MRFGVLILARHQGRGHHLHQRRRALWRAFGGKQRQPVSIYDLTSSGITQSWSKVAPNANRIGEPIIDNNFGMIEIDWEARSLQLVLTDLYGKERIRQRVAFDELK